MTENDLIKMYSRCRVALICTAPVAMWGFMLWLSGGEMLPALAFGGAVMLPLLDILPSAGEVKHRLISNRKRTEGIWFKML